MVFIAQPGRASKAPATRQSHSTDTSVRTKTYRLRLSPGHVGHSKGGARYVHSSKTYRCPGSEIPTLVVVRTVRGRLAVVLGRGIGLGGVESVVRVRIHAGPGGVCADLTNRRRFHPETQQNHTKQKRNEHRTAKSQGVGGWVGEKVGVAKRRGRTTGRGQYRLLEQVGGRVKTLKTSHRRLRAQQKSVRPSF